MRVLLAALLFATPALGEVDSGHSGVVKPRAGSEPSDMALFAMAAAGLWFARRAMRARICKD